LPCFFAINDNIFPTKGQHEVGILEVENMFEVEQLGCLGTNKVENNHTDKPIASSGRDNIAM